MSRAANILRGEVTLELKNNTFCLRPTFSALVAAEAETGSLFSLIERAGEGRLCLAEMTALLWHCLDNPPTEMTREIFSEQLLEAGLATVTPAFKAILHIILAGA